MLEPDDRVPVRSRPGIPTGTGLADAAPPLCHFLIESKEGASEGFNEGSFVSPAYPGVHPSALSCLYKFVGHQSERVHITIENMNLPATFAS